LRAHVETCAVCHDLVNVAHAFAAAGDESGDLDALPEPSRIWWTAQLQAREDAARRAARPITVTHAVAFAAIVGVLGALLGASSSWLQATLKQVGAWLSSVDVRTWSMPAPVASVLTDHAVLVVVLVLCCCLTPLVAYLVLREN
jgi:hypothetical protein